MGKLQNMVSLSEQQRLFTGNMWIIWDFASPAKQYDKFLKKGRPIIKSFIEGLLLHDQIIGNFRDVHKIITFL